MRLKHGHLQHLAVSSIGKVAVCALQLPTDQADWRFLIGRIEDQQGLPVRGFHARLQARIVFAVWQFDGSDHMVADQRRRRGWIALSAPAATTGSEPGCR